MMASARACAAAASRPRCRQRLHRQPVAAVEPAVPALAGHSVAAVEGPGRRRHRRDRGGRQETVAVVQQHPPNPRQVPHRNPQPTLRRKQRAILPQTIGGQIARAALGRIDRACRRTPLQVVGRNSAARLVQHHGPGRALRAARCPVEAGIEPERRDHQPLHGPVEPLAGRAFDHGGNDGEVEVGVAEILARPMGGVPGPRIGDTVAQRLAQRDRVIGRVGQPRAMRQQQPEGDRHIGIVGMPQPPAQSLRHIGVEVERAGLHQPHHAHGDDQLGDAGHPHRIVRGDAAPGAPVGDAAGARAGDAGAVEGDPHLGGAWGAGGESGGCKHQCGLFQQRSPFPA